VARGAEATAQSSHDAARLLPREMLMRRRVFFATAIAVALANAVTLTAEAAESLKSVKFTLPWAYQGDHAFWSEAIDNGTFRDLGLDVHMDRGYGSGDAIVKEAAGAYDICFAEPQCDDQV
jgi:NitT/TauT family transport system substrate-binding protein